MIEEERFINEIGQEDQRNNFLLMSSININQEHINNSINLQNTMIDMPLEKQELNGKIEEDVEFIEIKDIGEKSD
jgi:hypothetical protein